MKYSKVKYHVEEDDSLQTDIKGYNIDLDWCRLTSDGILTAKRHFSCDGPSGPTIDSVWTIRPAVFHDVIAKLIRMGLLPIIWKPYSDGLFYMQLLRDCRIYYKNESMDLPKLLRPMYLSTNLAIMERRAWLWYLAVCNCSDDAYKPENENPIYETPKEITA